MNEAIQLANDRPTQLNDDLYQWSTDAEEMLRSQAVALDKAYRLLMKWCNDALSTEQVKLLEAETMAVIKEQLI